MINQADINCIIDRYFYESYKKMQDKKVKSLSYYMVRTFALLLIIPINYIILEQAKNQRLSLLTIFLAITLAYTLLQTCFSAYFYCAYVNNKTYLLKIAAEYHHCHLSNNLKSLENDDLDEEMNLYQKEQTLGLLVSSVYYDFQNMEKIGDVSQEFKSMRESNGCSIIKNSLQASLPCFKSFQSFFMFISVFIFAFGITVSIMNPLNQTQHSLLEMVLISEVMFQPRVYAILMVVCLVPVIILVTCCYCCCCKRSELKAKLPEKTKATSQIISKCAECSICFLNFNLEDEVAVLPCSDLHVFHYGCIEGWTKIKPNCPNCRHLLT